IGCSEPALNCVDLTKFQRLLECDRDCAVVEDRDGARRINAEAGEGVFFQRVTAKRKGNEEE
ncbi:MAG: hypothetical protein ABGW50_01050, partial [Thermococcus sp.]